MLFKSNVSTSIMSVASPTTPLPVVGSVSGSINIVGNPSVSGTVNIGNVPQASVHGVVGASIIGLVPVTFAATANQSVSGTVGSSIIGIVPVTQSGTQITSISGTVVIQSVVGTYAEDAGHSSGDAGLLALAVRNDTLVSITSADNDYSPQAVGPSGEVLTANAPLTKWVRGVASVFTGVIQPIVPAQGASIFSYITSGQVANASANNVYLTFYGAADSVIGYLPVPANSCALPIMPNAWKTNANGAFSASVSGVASVFLSFQGFISKT